VAISCFDSFGLSREPERGVKVVNPHFLFPKKELRASSECRGCDFDLCDTQLQHILLSKDSSLMTPIVNKHVNSGLLDF
jgi:hypothetical protein